jgi:hypothetical protein
MWTWSDTPIYRSFVGILLLCFTSPIALLADEKASFPDTVTFPDTSAPSSIDTIIFPKQQDITEQQNTYFYKLLELILTKTQHEFGAYALQPTRESLPQKRAVLMLEKNQRINLFWTMTSRKREEKLRAVYFPLLKGLLGHRVFIIRSSDQHKFNRVNTLEDLKQLTAAQGVGWPDVDILKSNGLKVIETLDYKNLIDMLKAKRYDYYPRGITEAWGELNQLNDEQLMIESRLLLRYKAPLYFFVNKDNQRLHNRLYQGLILSLKDGSFDQLFYQESNVTQGLQKANINARLVFDLSNPDVLDSRIFDQPDLWITIPNQRSTDPLQ